MSGPSNAQTDVVWPGYVAAMASLLLSLLLVTAVLVVTISQIGSVSESYQQAITDTGFKSREDVDRIAKEAGLAEADPSLVSQDASASDTGVVGKSNSSSKSLGSTGGSMGSMGITATDAARPPLDFSRANFDPEAARAAAKLAAQDAELLAQIDLSKVDVTQISFVGVDLSTLDLSRNISPATLKKIDFSKVNFGVVAQGRITVLKPFIAKEAVRYQLQKVQWQQQLDQRLKQLAAQQVSPKAASSLALTSTLTPPAAVTPAPAPPALKIELPKAPPDKLEVTFVEEAVSLLPAQKQQLLQALDSLQKQTSSIRISANLPNEDIYLKRTAYARVISLRALAIEAGFAPGRVQVGIDTVPGMAEPQSDMTLYVSRLDK